MNYQTTVQVQEPEAKLTPLFVSEGVLTPPIRSKGSQIGKIVCPITGAVIHTASGTEHNAAMCLFADPAIRKVVSQPVRFDFTLPNGEQSTHVLDFRATRADAFQYGVLVKVADKAEAIDLDGFAAMLASQISPAIANELRPLTDEQMPEWQVRNARLFRKTRVERRTFVDAHLEQLAPGLVVPKTIAELSDMLGGGRIAFRPIVRSIFYGTLTRLADGLIEPGNYVQFSGQVMPDLEATKRPDPGLERKLYRPPVRKAKVVVDA